MSINGNVVVVRVHNPDSAPASTRVRVKVVIDGGAEQTLESASVVVPPGQDRTVNLTASDDVQYTTDGPAPF